MHNIVDNMTDDLGISNHLTIRNGVCRYVRRVPEDLRLAFPFAVELVDEQDAAAPAAGAAHGPYLGIVERPPHGPERRPEMTGVFALPARERRHDERDLDLSGEHGGEKGLACAGRTGEHRA